jgi:hypothetical protein
VPLLVRDLILYPHYPGFFPNFPDVPVLYRQSDLFPIFPVLTKERTSTMLSWRRIFPIFPTDPR